MGPLANIFPTLPWTTIEIIMNVVAGLGAIMIIYGVFLEAETKQDAVFTIGSFCLFVYALWVGNTIFSIAMGGFAIGSFIELVEIMLGRHTHSAELVEKYKHPSDS
jgi:hypothetical protein